MRRRDRLQRRRWIDGAVASLDALPPVVEAARNQPEVLFDSGMRTGHRRT
ncbi:alpha-hydroxy-acid oxidizing protein [Actinomadura sp. NBRC 104425]|nr:alpha-hydroxy-acid oxidizing protein [Actinomadura sp. NBRC 104425]